MASPTAAPGQFPEQLVIMVKRETRDRIVADAERHKLSKSEVARTYLEAGISHADEVAAESAHDVEVEQAAALAGGV